MKISDLKSNFKFVSQRFRIISVLQILIMVVGVFVTVFLIRETAEYRLRAAPQEAVYYFETTSRNVTPGEEFWAQLFIDSCRGSGGCADISSAGVTLKYNPLKLQVIDAAGNPANSVTIGDYATGSRIFPSWAENSVDNTNGTIKVSGFMANMQTGEKGTPFNGVGIFISVRFRVLMASGTTQVTYDYVPFSDTANRGSDGSNIFWAGAPFDDILNLGDSPNPTALTVSIVQPQGASLSLVRADTTSLDKGNRFDVNVVVNSGGARTVATDVIIRYPTNLLRVIDADSSTSGVQVTHGNIYENYEYANATGIDTKNGIIDLSGYTLTGTQPLSDAIFATIRFEVLDAGTATLTFDYTEGRRDESNILEYQPGVDIQVANDLLQSVSSLALVLSAKTGVSPTPTSVPTATPTPIPTATPTPRPTATPTPTSVPPTATPTTCFRRGDISSPRDCCVNGADVSVMVARWGWITKETDSYVDLDGNSKVNGADISILVANWGGTCR